MYEDLEKESLYYKGQYEEMNKENELLIKKQRLIYVIIIPWQI